MLVVQFFQLGVLVLLFLFIAFYLYKKYIGQTYNGAYFLPTTNVQLKVISDYLQSYKQKKIVDLGSGDGRILIYLSRQSFDVTGYEISSPLYLISKLKIWLYKLSSKAKVFRINFWNINLAEFDVVILFGIAHMLPDIQMKLKKELKPGSLVISVKFQLLQLTLMHKSNNVFFHQI